MPVPTERARPPARAPPAARRPRLGHRLGRDRPAVRGRRARPAGAHLLRRRPPLRAGPGRGPRAGQHARPTRCAWTASRSGRRTSRRSRRAGSARRATGTSSGSPSAPAATRRPRTVGRRERHPAGRPGLLRRAHRRPARGPVARRAGAARRPGLRRRADPADAVVAALRRGDARQPRRTPRSTDFEEYTRLYAESWSDPAGALAAVDGPVVDDLRRPRDDRRLEHLGRLAPGDHRPAVVAGPDQRRAGQLLGLPAPGQPQPAGAGREQDLAGDPGPADDDSDDAEPMLREMAEQADAEPGEHPVELRAALGRRAADHDRQPRRPGARGAGPPDGRRRRVRLDRGGDAAVGRRGRAST